MATANRAIVAHLTEDVWNEGRIGELSNLIAPNFTLHDAASGQNIAGIEPLREWISGLRSAFPDLEMTSDETLSEGEAVAQRWTIKGTHKGEFMGVRGTGRPVTVSGSTVYHFRNGLINEMYVTYDRLRVLEQVGAGATMQARS